MKTATSVRNISLLYDKRSAITIHQVKVIRPTTNGRGAVHVRLTNACLSSRLNSASDRLSTRQYVASECPGVDIATMLFGVLCSWSAVCDNGRRFEAV